ncbi:hypothetical protein ACJBPZ_11175, partial [Streptococcus suis]
KFLKKASLLIKIKHAIINNIWQKFLHKKTFLFMRLKINFIKLLFFFFKLKRVPSNFFLN